MEKQIMQVKEFQEAIGAPMPRKPTLLDDERAKLRHRLLSEEIDEIQTAQEEGYIVGVADGIIDAMYILIGTAHEYGIADRMIDLFDEVQRSNMSKCVDGKMIFREDGKVLKPETYSKPNLAPIMDRDYSVYDELESDLSELDEIFEKEFWAKITSTISNLLTGERKELFDKYSENEKEINKFLKINMRAEDGRSVAEIYIDGNLTEVWE